MRPRSIFLLTASLFCSVFVACQNSDPMPVPEPPVTSPGTEKIDLLALGDSYTKGESVPTEQNFPSQLWDSLRAQGRSLLGRRVIAQTGWRTDQLKNAIAAASELSDSTFSLVTLCIGVNNQYQHASFDTYKKEFEQLLQTAIARAGGRAKRVMVISIPDWAYTPYGQSVSSPATVSQQIDQYNAANQALAQQYGVYYVDVTGISRRGLAEPELVAGDGLHPSARQYTEWVRVLLPVVNAMLEE